MTSRCECRDACGPRVSTVGSMLQTSALWACRLPRGLEHASHVLGRALWHALALTDASPRAPQVCSTSREDKRTGFTVPPQTTRDLLGHPRERERLGEGTSSTRGEGGGGMEEQEERCIQSQRAELPQVMMMISIVPLQKQTELGSIYLEEGTDLGDTRQETQHGDIDTVLKRPLILLPRTPFPNPALRSPPSPSLLFRRLLFRRQARLLDLIAIQHSALLIRQC